MKKITTQAVVKVVSSLLALPGLAGSKTSIGEGEKAVDVEAVFVIAVAFVPIRLAYYLSRNAVHIGGTGK